MRSELKYVAPEPEPEEYTEEQTLHPVGSSMNSETFTQVGQRLTIPNRAVSKLGFWLYKYGAPAGDVTFKILRVSDDGLICSKKWGNAEDLPIEFDYKEVTFDTPQTINEEVRILAEFAGGDGSNGIRQGTENSDVKEDEYLTKGVGLVWTDAEIWDCAYRYKYYEV
ncbi:hypothetical protein ES708_22600 [subsurface metagenome]